MLKRPLPLRTRLALGYSLFFAIVLTLLCVGVYLAVRNALLREASMQLQTTSDIIANDFNASDAELSAFFRDSTSLLRATAPAVEGLESPSLYVQVSSVEGVILASSPSLKQERLPLTVSQRAQLQTGSSLQVIEPLGSASVLILARPLSADQEVVGILQVAQSLREIDQTLRLLVTSLSVIGLVSLLLAVRAGSWLARRALEPVAQVTQTAQQIISADDLGRRVPAVPVTDEIGQLVVTINTMLERLDHLFQTQRRFVADVSHELRTPLAAIRGHLEVLRREATHDPAALDESLADITREVERLGRMSGDLLLLMQTEIGTQLRYAPLALDDLLLEIVRDLSPLAQGVALRPIVQEQLEVQGDRDRLQQALINLTANALHHTPAGGRVELELSREDGLAVITVRDTGHGIAATDLPSLFEPFYRADTARDRQSGGTGLGLAIVKWIAEAHGGSVSVDSVLGHGSTFRMTIPVTKKLSQTEEKAV